LGWCSAEDAFELQQGALDAPQLEALVRFEAAKLHGEQIALEWWCCSLINARTQERVLPPYSRRELVEHGQLACRRGHFAIPRAHVCGKDPLSIGNRRFGDGNLTIGDHDAPAAAKQIERPFDGDHRLVVSAGGLFALLDGHRWIPPESRLNAHTSRRIDRGS